MPGIVGAPFCEEAGQRPFAAFGSMTDAEASTLSLNARQPSGQARIYRKPTPASAADPGQSFSYGTCVSGASVVLLSSCRSDDCSSM
jgi:hypothetical protein